MAFTLGEETILKALVVKLVIRRQAANNIPAKRAAILAVLQNRQSAINTAKTVQVDGNMTTELIDPTILATIQTTFDPQIATAQADLQKTIDDSQADIVP